MKNMEGEKAVVLEFNNQNVLCVRFYLLRPSCLIATTFEHIWTFRRTSQARNKTIDCLKTACRRNPAGASLQGNPDQ
jgi:hypothetical protein